MNTHVRDNLQYLKDIQDGVQEQDFAWSRGSTDVTARTLTVQKARGTLGAPSAIAAADNIYDIRTLAYHAGAYRNATLLRAWVETVGASFIDGAIDFYTYRSTDGGALLAARAHTGTLGVADGAVGNPGLHFYTDPDNGLYRIGADDWALAVGGSKALELLKVSGTAYISPAVSFLAQSTADVALSVRARQTSTVNTFDVRRDVGGGTFTTDFAVNQSGRCIFGAVSGGALGALGGKIEVVISGVTKYVPYYDS
jgi:hypothetical protein